MAAKMSSWKVTMQCNGSKNNVSHTISNRRPHFQVIIPHDRLLRMPILGREKKVLQVVCTQTIQIKLQSSSVSIEILSHDIRCENEKYARHFPLAFWDSTIYFPTHEISQAIDTISYATHKYTRVEVKNDAWIFYTSSCAYTPFDVIVKDKHWPTDEFRFSKRHRR